MGRNDRHRYVRRAEYLLARAEWYGNGYAVSAGKGAVFAFGHAGAKKMLDGHMPGQMAEIVAGGVGGFVQVSKGFET
jgi:hypothetical protein